MSRSMGRLLLCGLLAAVYVWFSCDRLPDPVASHFVASGVANGFMPRGFYRGFMLVIVVGLPLLTTAFTHALLRRPDARINLPRSDYWLAPQRRSQTVAFICSQSDRFGLLLMLFLCYAHGLVVHANGLVPPRLSNTGMLGGLLLLGVVLAWWLWGFYVHFRRDR